MLDGHPRIELDIKAIERVSRHGSHFPRVKSAPEAPRPPAAEKQIFDYGEFGKEIELLGDEANTAAFSLVRRSEACRDALRLDPSLRRPQKTCEALHRGALSGAVLADNGVNLARREVEVEAPAGEDAAKRHAEVTQSKFRFFWGYHWHRFQSLAPIGLSLKAPITV